MTPSPKKKQILVVEDDQYIRDVIKELLELEGYQVEVAENGRVGLDLLRTLDKPSLILLDLMMPVMNGVGFRREQELDPRHGNVPVVIMTADGHIEAKKQLLGAKAFLRKPLEIDELVSAVKQFAL